MSKIADKKKITTAHSDIRSDCITNLGTNYDNKFLLFKLFQFSVFFNTSAKDFLSDFNGERDLCKLNFEALCMLLGIELAVFRRYFFEYVILINS